MDQSLFEAVAVVNDVRVQCKTQLRIDVDHVYCFMTTVDHFLILLDLHVRPSSL